jgi:hypothetical protein
MERHPLDNAREPLAFGPWDLMLCHGGRMPLARDRLEQPGVVVALGQGCDAVAR